MIDRVRSIITEFKPEYDFNSSDNFVVDGYLDSLDIIELLSVLEKEFGIKFNGDDVKVEHFISFQSLTDLIDSKTS